MAPARILVTVEHPEGSGGVVREGGHAWLSLRVPQAVTRLDDHRPAVIGLEDRTLQGGLLPEGAVTAWATDDRGERHRAAAGDGAWAIVLEQPADGRPGPVCFRDGAGGLVAPVLPAGWARTPVLDADEPCPACGSAGCWDEVVADDQSRGTQGFAQRPTPFVVCRACGHEHSVGVFYAGRVDGDESSAEELARLRREADARRRLEARTAFAELAFGVFVARGRPGRLGGWGRSNGVLNRVEIEYEAAGEAGPWLRVITDHERFRYDSEAALARSALRAVLAEERRGTWPQRSSAGLAIWLDGVERAARLRAAWTEVQRRSLLVDGEPMAVASLAWGEHCSAAGRRGDRLLIVTAYEIDPVDVELISVTDPLAALDSM